MKVYHDTFPRAYPEIIEELSNKPDTKSRVGDTKEEWMVAVQSDNPRERHMFRPKYNLAFQLQECLAYWLGLNTGDVERYNSNMKMFMTDGQLNGSAYGERLRECPDDQIKRIAHQIRDSPDTRRAVAIIHNPYVEIYDGIDVACTIYLHFMQRDGKLHLTSNMRSQDLMWGSQYDTVAFQWIQEAIAGILDLELGTFTHIMNSCHYYTDREDQVADSTDYEIDTTPDCRLSDGVLTDNIMSLSQIVYSAQNEIACRVPDWMHSFYSDWANVMVAYEFCRFHNDFETSREYAQNIQQDQWKAWTMDTIHHYEN